MLNKKREWKAGKQARTAKKAVPIIKIADEQIDYQIDMEAIESEIWAELCEEVETQLEQATR